MSQWIDLSAHDARLVVYTAPGAATRLALKGVMPKSSQAKALETIGFKLGNDGKTFLREGTKIGMGEIAPIFPRARVRDMDPAQIVIKTAAPLIEEGSPPPVSDPVFLGLNHLGQEVYAGHDGRFLRIKDEQDRTVRETDGAQGALFLRPATQEDVAQCADGFVQYMLQGNHATAETIKQVAAVWYDQKESVPNHSPLLRTVQEAIESAIGRAISERYSVATPEAYADAVRVYELQPPMVFRSSTSVANQQYSTPSPLALAAQYILGSTAGATVLEPTIGNASLVTALPAGTKVVGVEIDGARAASANRLVNANGRSGEVLHGDFLSSRAMDRVDYVVANPPFGGLAAPVIMDGLKVTRLDHLILMRSLKVRNDSGRGVYIVAADRENMFAGGEGKVSGGSRNLFNWLADHYELEDVVELTGRLYEKQGASYPIRMVTVGRKLTDEEAANARATKSRRIGDTVKVVHSWSALWEHVSALAHTLAGRTAPEAPLDARESKPSRVANAYQADYQAFSKLNDPGDKKIPVNLEAPTYDALAALVDRNGDIDDFVSGKLKMSKVELAQAFQAQQIDALAQAIDAHERGRAYIVGDMTGVGKGRFLAGLARYARLHGMPVLFLTEKPNLFTDFWRDLAGIGEAENVNPLILNSGEEIRDGDNKVLHKSPKPQVINALLEGDDRISDHGYNVMFATYSQFNREMQKSRKAAFLRAQANGAMMILDESHTAAGDSNTGENLIDATAKELAAGVVYSSATYSKRPENIPLYHRVFPEYVTPETLVDSLAAGGQQLYEVLSAQLAADGVFARREIGLDGIEFSTLEPKSLDANITYTNAFAEVMAAMAYVSGDVESLVERANKENRDRLKKLPESARAGARLAVSSMNFGSRFYAINRQFQMAMRSDLVVEQAIAAAQEGKKPVISLSQTMETIANEVADEDGLIGADVDFRVLLKRLSDKLLTITTTNGYGLANKENIYALAKDEDERERIAAAFQALNDAIDSFPEGLTAFPLDYVQEKLEAAGLAVGEVSGRKTRVVKEGGAYALAPRTDDRVGTVFEFQNGKCDVLILSDAGSTGLSAHADPGARNQQQRVGLIFDPQLDINKMIQTLGRTNRNMQVVKPEYRFMSTGMPAERRLYNQLGGKLSSLSANTQSNRDSAVKAGVQRDILNPVGDRAALQVFMAHPSVARLMDVSLEPDDIKNAGETHFVDRLTSRAGILRYDEQVSLMNELDSEFDAEVERLVALGQDPFKTKLNDYRAVEVEKTIFSPGKGDDSVFGAPVYLTKLQWKEKLDPIRYEAVEKLVMHAKERPLDTKRLISLAEASFDHLQKGVIIGKFSSVKEALDAKDDNVVKQYEGRRKYLRYALDNFTPGTCLSLPLEGEIVRGVIVNVTPPKPKNEHFLGQYEVRIAVPGQNRTIFRSFMTLRECSAEPSFIVTMPDMKRPFDDAPQGEVTRERVVLTGNLLTAFSDARRLKGRGESYTDEKGEIRRAVFFPMDTAMEDIMQAPIALARGSDYLAVVETHGKYPDITLNQDSDAKIAYNGYGGYDIVVPGSKGDWGHVFANEKVTALTGEFYGNRAAMRASFDEGELPHVLDAIIKTGVAPYIPRDFVLGTPQMEDRQLMAAARH